MKILIRKFKALENVELEIPIEIRGGNGTGKSTIFEAIAFVFTGKNPLGKEFEQLYDNRVDLHDAIADVSYFDNYNNEWRRVVAPIFQTGRDGVESIKTKCSTTCSKNGIACNDFSDEFVDFLKFGTSYFFTKQNGVDLETMQRQIFVDLLKSKLPDYDVNAASLKLKELKRSQKTHVSEIDTTRKMIKGLKDAEIPIIPVEIIELNKQHDAVVKYNASQDYTEITKQNNEALQAYYTEKRSIETKLSNRTTERNTESGAITSLNLQLESLQGEKFVPDKRVITETISEQLDVEFDKILSLQKYDTIEDYAKANFDKNPVLVENRSEIKRLMSLEFVDNGEINSACPLSGEACQTAALYSESAAKLRFKNSIDAQVAEIKAQNKTILTREFEAANYEYMSLQSKINNLQIELEKAYQRNDMIDQANERGITAFEKSKLAKETELKTKLHAAEAKKADLEKQIISLESQLSTLEVPIPFTLPDQEELPQELIDAHAEFVAIEKEIIGAHAINANNVKIKEKAEAEIKSLQSALMVILEEITTLTAEISDYFSNLKDVVKSEFSGEIELDIQLLEYVMSKDEYKDCFKIVANGKVFPYECNGALQNNVKLQLLSNLQKIKGYTGVTIMDNCEANTTQPINICNTNAVLTFATFDKELVFTKTKK